MAVARPLLLRIQNPFRHEVHLGQGFQICQIGPDPSPSPFLLLATPEKNCHLSSSYEKNGFNRKMNTFFGSMSKNVLVWTFLTTNDVGNEGSDAISL